MPEPAWQPTTPPLDAASAAQFLRRNRAVILHFWAGWNADDRAMDEVLRHIRRDHPGNVEFRSMDSELPGNWAFSLQAGVTNWPALACYVDGRKVELITGLRSRNDLRAWIAKHTAHVK